MKKQSEDLFRKSHGVLGLLDLPVAWWLSKTSVFCVSGHLSAHFSPDIYIYIYIYIYVLDFFDFFHGVRNIQKSRPISVEKGIIKKWTFRFFEKFYLNLLEIIFNESSYTFRFLIENPTHIYIQGSYWFWYITQRCSQSIKMQHFLSFNTHETMELCSYFFLVNSHS